MVVVIFVVCMVVGVIGFVNGWDGLCQVVEVEFGMVILVKLVLLEVCFGLIENEIVNVVIGVGVGEVMVNFGNVIMNLGK